MKHVSINKFKCIRYLWTRLTVNKDNCWIWNGTLCSKDRTPKCHYTENDKVYHAPHKLLYYISFNEYPTRFLRRCRKDKLCVNPHHQRPSTLEFYESDFIISDKGCHLYQGALNSEGYGIVGQKNERLTRLILEKHIRKLGPKEVACHKCDTPRCINLQHLFIGSIKDNNTDKRNKQMKQTDGKIRLSDLAKGLKTSSANLRLHLKNRSGLGINATKFGDRTTGDYLLDVDSVLRFLTWLQFKAKKVKMEDILRVQEELTK